MKEKQLFTAKEWEEMEMMQERAKAKRQEAKANAESNARAKKKDKTIGLIMMLFIGFVNAVILAPTIANFIKIAID